MHAGRPNGRTSLMGKSKGQLRGREMTLVKTSRTFDRDAILAIPAARLFADLLLLRRP